MADLAGIKANLLAADPGVSLEAAASLAALYVGGGPGSPSLEESFALLKDCDRINPGVADMFWSEVMYDCTEWELVPKWIFEILQQRSRIPIPAQAPLHSLPSNDLEFHAHEVFDEDEAALRQLLQLGYGDVVLMALDHNCLPAERQRAFLADLATSAEEKLVEGGCLGLWWQFHLIHPEAEARRILRRARVAGTNLVVVGYPDAQTAPLASFFVCLEPQGDYVSVDTFWSIFFTLMKDLKIGAEIKRSELVALDRFSIVPKLPGKMARTRFFDEGYAATVFGEIQRDRATQIRVDPPAGNRRA